MTSNKFRALIVEDDHDTRNLFKNFLEYEGFEVVTQRHPNDVQDVTGYTLVLMDVHFGSPALDGIEWVRKQRRLGQVSAETKIVFTTGFAIQDLKVDDHVLAKPIELTALRKLIPEIP